MSKLAQKLHPKRFTAMSGKMAALVGFFIGAVYTEPAIASLVITSDCFVLAMHEGEIGYDNFIGSMADLCRNWTALLECAGLTEEERDEANRLFSEKF